MIKINTVIRRIGYLVSGKIIFSIGDSTLFFKCISSSTVMQANGMTLTETSSFDRKKNFHEK